MLAREDQALLREILKLGHELETAWSQLSPAPESQLPVTLQIQVQSLAGLIQKTALSKSSDLNRLHKWAEHLSSEMTARHFSGLLVPFERLSQRTLRDDEFVLTDQRDSDAKDFKRLNLVPILENMRSAFNVGAVFRTVEALGLERIILAGYTPGPDDEKTAKTAMGTTSDVPWSRMPSGLSAVDGLRSEGYTVIALETAPTAQSLPQFEFPERCALLLGNERFGLDPETLAKSDRILRIPLRGKKNSLNVGIAFGIAAYEFVRQRGER